MIPFRSMPRPALFALLALLGLAGCLAAHLWRTRQDVRIVSPLPLAAPGFTLEDAEGADIRVIPLAGARLHSTAAHDAGGAEPPRTTRRTAP
ncbi:MAG TPA: hypothetical protein H9774_03380 [Candidatus Desulfovibrio gallistercoris]|nr:hypothetical protein [Candidatus Desulfovibrio gallistercoris]